VGRVGSATAPIPRRNAEGIAVAGAVPPQPESVYVHISSPVGRRGGCAVDPSSRLARRSVATPRRRSSAEPRRTPARGPLPFPITLLGRYRPCGRATPCSPPVSGRPFGMVRRIGVLVLLVCGLSTAPFGSMEQGTPAASDVVSGPYTATRSSSGPCTDRMIRVDDGSDPAGPDATPANPSRPPATAGAPVPRAAREGAGVGDRGPGAGPRLTYRATAPPHACSS
jgi:hypothetical protein